MILLKGKLYDTLKFLALLVFPALGTLYFALAGIWGLPHAEQVVGTIVAIDTFLGVCLQLSSTAYNKSDDKYDGDVVFEEGIGGKQVVQLELNEDPNGLPTRIEDRGELRFKVKKVREAQKQVGARSRGKHRV